MVRTAVGGLLCHQMAVTVLALAPANRLIKILARVAGEQGLVRGHAARCEHDGLGFVPGQVCPLAPDLGDKSLKVPQIGWNAVHILRDDPLFKYVRDGEYFYYVHSYYGKNCAANTLAVSDYSLPVTGVVKAGKVYGTQFHPEKSGDAGLRLLKAFAEL